MWKNIPLYRDLGLSRAQTMSEARRAFAFAEAVAFPLRHPGPDQGSIAIKSLIAGGFFQDADAPWLDAGSSVARKIEWREAQHQLATKTALTMALRQTLA